MALALVLLVSSGLMIRSFQALRRVEPGFTEPERVQTFSVSIPATEVAEPERVTRMQHEIADQIAAIPGVASAAFTSRLPMDTTGRTSSPCSPKARLTMAAARPADRLGSSRQACFGRWERRSSWETISLGSISMDERDVAILSENLAREMWGSPAAALGKRIREGNGVWRDVVGVTGDIYDEGVHQPPTPTLFLPARLHVNTLGLPSVLSRRVTSSSAANAPAPRVCSIRCAKRCGR